MGDPRLHHLDRSRFQNYYRRAGEKTKDGGCFAEGGARFPSPGRPEVDVSGREQQELAVGADVCLFASPPSATSTDTMADPSFAASGARDELALELQPGGGGEIVLKSENAVALRTAKKVKGQASMMQGIDLDESKPVAEQLRAALVAKAVTVLALFREWDDDDSGCVTKKEFRRGMGEMGLDFPAAAMDELFDSWDPDGSGHLELKEMIKQLRRGNDITLAKELQAGGAGEIVLKSENNAKLRTKKVDRRRASMVQGIDLDESKPVAQQLRAALIAKAVRVIDLFREWGE